MLKNIVSEIYSKNNEENIETTRKTTSFTGINTSILGFRCKVTRVEVLQKAKRQNICFFLTLGYLFTDEFDMTTFGPNLYKGNVQGNKK